LPSSAEFKVTDPHAPARAARDGVRARARTLADDARAGTPVRTGRLRSGWRVGSGGNGDSRVANDVPYARFVEYGTRHKAPAAMLGRALARARAAQR
jgi:hypothetical protein